MNLSMYFEPLREELAGPLPSKTFGAATDRFVSKFPDWREADLALFGIHEYRGSLTNPGSEEAANHVRSVLYLHKHGSNPQRLVDLGNLRPGPTLEDTYLRLKEICEQLIAHNTIPIIIGGSHDLDYGQFLAYEHLERGINMVSVDSRFDMVDEDTQGENLHRFHKMLMHDPNFLFSFSQVGYQRYFVEAEVLAAIEKMHFEAIRVGEVHRHLEEVEPVIRNADMLTFDLSAIKVQDSPGNEHAAPFGLTSEEACQLCWYAGANDNLTSFGIYEYNPELDVRNQSAAVIATMIWYFVEGFYHRKSELIFDSKRFVKYAVAFNDDPNKMIFYKSRQTDKWWLEVPGMTDEQPVRIVPCSYNDYLAATKGEIPNRWMITQARMT